MFPRHQGPQPTPTVEMPPAFAAGYHGGSTTPDERNWALTAYIGQFLFWALPPLYVYFTKRGRSAYARHHGRQALNLALTTGIVFAAAVLLANWIPGALWVGLGWAAISMGLVVFSATRVNRGAWHTIPAPFAFKIVK
ncbi:hypothetical protein GCM10027589_28710 [Actinocorallia lasiicapitis]